MGIPALTLPPKASTTMETKSPKYSEIWPNCYSTKERNSKYKTEQSCRRAKRREAEIHSLKRAVSSTEKRVKASDYGAIQTATPQKSGKAARIVQSRDR